MPTLAKNRGRSYRPDRRGWQHHVYFHEANLVDACKRAGFAVLHAGKDVPRQHGGVLEPLRFGWMRAYTWLGKVSRFRREMQVIVRRPVGA